MSQPSGLERFNSLVQIADHFERPLSIFDLETTGLLGREVPGIVEIAALTVKPGGETLMFSTLVNPQMAIPASATKVHGIRNAQVDHLPSFARIAPNMARMLEQRVVSGFNTRLFDVPVLAGNCLRYGIKTHDDPLHLDVREVWKRVSGGASGTLSVVAKHYGVELGTAHRAEGDVLTTARILDAMIQRHGLEAVLNQAQPTRSMGSRRALLGTSRIKTTSQYARDDSLIRAELLQLAERRELIRPDDMVAIAGALGCEPKDVSFQASELIKDHKLNTSLFVDDATQALIRPSLDEAIRRAGSESLLKPIKLELDRLLERSIDYIQIRVALADRVWQPSDPDLAPF